MSVCVTIQPYSCSSSERASIVSNKYQGHGIQGWFHTLHGRQVSIAVRTHRGVDMARPALELSGESRNESIGWYVPLYKYLGDLISSSLFHIRQVTGKKRNHDFPSWFRKNALGTKREGIPTLGAPFSTADHSGQDDDNDLRVLTGDSLKVMQFWTLVLQSAAWATLLLNCYEPMDYFKFKPKARGIRLDYCIASESSLSHCCSAI